MADTLDDVHARPSVRPAVAVLLVILGLGLVVLWRIASGTEQHSWDRGAVAPGFVELTGGHSYAVSVPGGVPTEIQDGVSPEGLSCSVTAAGIGTRRLSLVPEQDGSKATNQIASFVAPVTGSVQLTCQRVPGVFVDDADDAGFDYAGVMLWLGVVALAIGLPLGLSVLRQSVLEGSVLEGSVLEGSAGAREDDEVE